MPADDSIEIEFPSLKRSAPELGGRVEPERAPGPIEAQLSPSGDDDLSWLTAIFDDDDDASDDSNEDSDADSDDNSPDYLLAEVRGIPDRPSQGIAAPDPSEDDSIDDGTTDPSPESDDLDGYVEASIEDPRPGEPDPTETASAAAPVRADGVGVDPSVDPGTDAEDNPADADGDSSSSAKKVAGFREEIMSTFSQMYN